ncbi:MAG: L-serine ammonia-lyase [Rhodothermales bacterium]
METISVFDLLKIGVGPSSSHTLGPWIACRRFAEDLSREGALSRVRRVRVRLYGSLAKTGKGHATDQAVLLCLSGLDPETVSMGAIERTLAEIQSGRRLRLSGERAVPFDLETDVQFLRSESRPFHPNALDVEALVDGEGWRTRTFYSVGGGFIVEEGVEASEEAAVPMPYPCTSGKTLRACCRETGTSISALMRANERAWRSDHEIDRKLGNIWAVMKACVHRGCHTDGVLPGSLGVQRRAARLHRRLLGTSEAERADPDAWIARLRTEPRDFSRVSKWVSLFAIAANEENAAMGRVVTAPTNGAAGVIPAVLLYYLCFCDGAEADVPRFLLTAGQIGILFKIGSTLSAAQGGCQAEIGVAAAMASAALTEVLGGSVEQAVMAAEIAMEHHLGLTCDPVGGLVQIPCIERNSMGAAKAISATHLALESDPAHAKVSLDAVIRSMWETALDMNDKYKETSEGGLAVNVSAC